jgi:hypothetical protein
MNSKLLHVTTSTSAQGRSRRASHKQQRHQDNATSASFSARGSTRKHSGSGLSGLVRSSPQRLLTSSTCIATPHGCGLSQRCGCPNIAASLGNIQVTPCQNYELQELVSNLQALSYSLSLLQAMCSRAASRVIYPEGQA